MSKIDVFVEIFRTFSNPYDGHVAEDYVDDISHENIF